MFTERYLIKIDPSKPGSDDNFIEMTSYEFVMFCKTEEGRSRKFHFAKVYADPDVDHDVYYHIECFPDEEKRYRQEDDRSNYLDSCEAQSGYTRISYNDIGDEHLNGEEVLEDMTVDVETMALNSVLKEELWDAVCKLPEKEYAVIVAMHYSGQDVTEPEAAARLGLTRSTVHTIHARAVNRLKKILKTENN